MAKLTGSIDRRDLPSNMGMLSRGGVAFDWVMVVLGLWLTRGVHLDAWVHHQFKLETLFTPWHGVLYSGFLALAAVLAIALFQNIRRGASWREALPSGYGLSLVGAAVFMVGGVGDMLWHTLFGIEVGIEALLSPTHLFLTLVLTGVVWWTVHLWAGSILLSGVTGWMLSYAFVQPQIADEKGAE